MRFLFMASAALLAGALSACGYKPLEAPCAMSEGGMPAAAEQPMPEPAGPQQNAVQALFYAEPEAARAPAPFSSVVGDCGPLRPINAGRLK
jgi:predicted small lipoprotein YifL